MNSTRTLPRTAGVLACEFWRRLAASPHCRGADAPQLAGADACGTSDSPRFRLFVGVTGSECLHSVPPLPLPRGRRFCDRHRH